MPQIFVMILLATCSTLCAAKALDEKTMNATDEERSLFSLLTSADEKLRTLCNNKVNGLALTRLSNNRAYFFASTTQTAIWTTADQICRNAKMHLVTINSAAEYDLIFSEAVRLGINTPGFWIGLNDRQVEGIYTWSENSKAPTLQFWAANQPGAGTTRNCVSSVAAIATIAASWTAAVACSTALPFICEVNDECSAYVSATRPNAFAG